jgi:hypothetical protein
MDSWDGHHPVTTTALLSIFDSAVNGTIDLTVADRVLYTVCEIRSAVATRNLVRHLGREDTVGVLRSCADAFSAIGAAQSARDLRRAADDVATARTASRQRQCRAVLEDRLLCTEDAVDALIARYAWGRLKARARRPDRTPLAAPTS